MSELIVIKSEASPSTICMFCKKDENDEVRYGPLYQLQNVVAHYFCVLLSHNMVQNGEDDEGMLGFLLPDIKAELRRSRNIICVYCRLPGASIKCSSKCKVRFHLPCGQRRGSMHHFQDSFNSFCLEHRPIQDVPLGPLRDAETSTKKCSICHEEVDCGDLVNALWAPCCVKTWYHRLCIQTLALSAGYFFKCAICNNKSKFRNWMVKYGVLVPERDASWEMEAGAFGDLLHRHGNCDADTCLCPEGRQCDRDNTRWEVILCDTCGSHGIHVHCGRLKFSDPKWQCPVCAGVERRPADADSPTTMSAGLQEKLKEFHERVKRYTRELGESYTEEDSDTEESSRQRGWRSRGSVLKARGKQRSLAWQQNAHDVASMLAGVSHLTAATAIPRCRKVMILREGAMQQQGLKRKKEPAEEDDQGAKKVKSDCAEEQSTVSHLELDLEEDDGQTKAKKKKKRRRKRKNRRKLQKVKTGKAEIPQRYVLSELRNCNFRTVLRIRRLPCSV